MLAPNNGPIMNKIYISKTLPAHANPAKHKAQAVTYTPIISAKKFQLPISFGAEKSLGADGSDTVGSKLVFPT